MPVLVQLVPSAASCPATSTPPGPVTVTELSLPPVTVTLTGWVKSAFWLPAAGVTVSTAVEAFAAPEPPAPDPEPPPLQAATRATGVAASPATTARRPQRRAWVGREAPSC